MLTLAEAQAAAPAHIRKSITQAVVDMVNNANSDPGLAEHIRTTFLTYTVVLQEGRYAIMDYVNAATFVSYRLMGWNNQDAWERTFPQRYQALVAAGKDKKTISAHVAGYTKGKLVTEILAKTVVPIWVTNQDAVQEAINTQVMLMRTAKSEMVQQMAANSVLTHVRRPEVQKVELDIGVKESDGMRELRDSLEALATQQKQMIDGGQSSAALAATPLIRAEDAEDAVVVPAHPSNP